MKDYYDILGVKKDATDSDVKKAFRALAQKYHPDKKGGNEAKFKEISEAYAVIGDKKKRAEYDSYGRTFAGGGNGGAGAQGFGGFDFSQFQQGFGGDGVEFDLGDIFGEVFGGRASGGAQRRRGRDISMDLELDFSEAAFGLERTVLIQKMSYCHTCEGSGAKGKETNTCSTCNGKGRVQETRRSILGTFASERVCNECFGTGTIPKTACPDCKGACVRNQQEEIKLTIPAGIDNGEMIRLSGKGEAIAHGTAGDLYIKIHVKPHKVFTRSGRDIRMTLNVKLTDALLGATYTVPTLEKDIDLKIPTGVAHGEILRVPSKGIPTDTRGRGDLLVTIHIDLPKKLSKSARKLIEELRSEGV